MNLRSYQKEAVSKVWAYIRQHKTGNPCVVIPTGGGKTPVLASICQDVVEKWDGRVLILAHVKELLSQAYESVPKVAPELRDKIGLYSSGLKSKQKDKQVTIAGIQSVYSKADQLGVFNIIIIDEAHLITTEGNGRYRQFIKDSLVINPKVRIIGLTATPYRMKGGLICGKDKILNHICYEIGIKELISLGYLCNITAKAGKDVINTDLLKITRGEFDQREMDSAFDEILESACRDIVSKTRDRHSILCFFSCISHAIKAKLIIGGIINSRIECVFGDTDYDLRDKHTHDFKDGKIRYLINVNCLTTGFDAPNVDCIALIRATLSAGLFVQMTGRGLRIDPSKDNALLLDYGDNVMRHGPIDEIVIQESVSDRKKIKKGKECPECEEIVALASKICKSCGFVWPVNEVESSHNSTASDLSPISSNEKPKPKRYMVLEVDYSVHIKQSADEDHPKSMRVTYYTSDMFVFSEYVCVEHLGYAFNKAMKWWTTHTDDRLPASAQDAVDMMSSGGAALVEWIEVEREGAFNVITDRSIQKNTEMQDVEFVRMAEDEVPF